MDRLAAWRKQMWLILMVKINGCGYLQLIKSEHYLKSLG